jgi:hypothetical protein
MSVLRWLGFAVMAGFAGLAGLILVGYTASDPGGWQALGLVAAVGVPLALLCLLAYLRPSVALPVLAVGVLAPVGFGVLQLLDYQRWNAWEDTHGPLGLVLLLAVAVPLAVLGLSRPRAAGWLMLAAALAPVLLATIGAGADWARPLSIGLVLLPVAASGTLFVLAGRSGTQELHNGGALTPRRGSPRSAG